MKVQQLFTILCAAVFCAVSAQAAETICAGGFGSALSGIISGDVLVPENKTCLLGGSDMEDTTVLGDVQVEMGGTLQVRGGGVFLPVLITGSIYSDTAARLEISSEPTGASSNGVVVSGDIVVNNNDGSFCQGVNDKAKIEGNVQIYGNPEGSEDVVTLNFNNCEILGMMQVFENKGIVQVLENEVAGDLQIVKNSGDVAVENNTIGATLRVRKNSGESVIIRTNTITGKVRIRKNTVGVETGLLIDGNDIGNNLNCVNNVPLPSPGSVNNVGGNKKNQCREDLGF